MIRARQGRRGWRWAAALLLVLGAAQAASAQQAAWPRKIAKQGNTFVYYQPQVDDWKSFSELSWRMAFSLTPSGGKEVIGVAELQGHTEVDNDNKLVLITNLQIKQTNYPGLDPTRVESTNQLLKTFLPESITVSLHEVVASVNKSSTVTSVPVKNDPPTIFVSYTPAVLLLVEGEPVLTQIPNTGMMFVVNTPWPLFFEQAKGTFYLLVGQRWMTASGLSGPWTMTSNLPKDMAKVAGADPRFADLKKAVPPPAQLKDPVPTVFFSKTPAEVILFEGDPQYAQIPDTKLMYATNTSSYVFLHSAKNQYYYLTAGRWFRANALQGPWSFATTELPPDFAAIPEANPAAVVLASVPGTDAAKDAVLLAQVPTVMKVNVATAAASVNVVYDGEPTFAAIPQTSLFYATNTADKVIRVGSEYYLCLQGVWFLSTTAQGPWKVAPAVPQAIYTIPPSSPVYNVTYVTQVTVDNDHVESSYTAGYVGAFVFGFAAGAIIATGSGWYYPPYMYRPPYGYPIYRPYPYYGGWGYHGHAGYYHSATGAYGVAHTVHGPYGAATRTASYNPYTGTYARTASVSTPYSSRSAGRAYNPYTGTYAATRQGSSPSAQWGSSVVTRGNQAAYTRHYSNAQGTASSIRTSSGGAAARVNTGYGQTTVGRTAGGDVYAGRDGNVYRNTGSGWQSYNNGSWGSVSPPTVTPTQQGGANRANQPSASRPSASQQPSISQQPSASQMQGLQQESRSRDRGAAQTGRFQQTQYGGGGGGYRGGGSRGGGGGGFRGGGRR